MGEEAQFVVEKILDDKVLGGIHYYKVKWEGYPESESTYEPGENLCSCADLVDKYMIEKVNSKLALREPSLSSDSDSNALRSSSDFEMPSFSIVTSPKPHRHVVTRLQYQRECFCNNKPVHDSDSDEFDEYLAVTGAFMEGDELIFTVQRQGGDTRQVTREELQKFHLRIYLEFMELLVANG